MVANITMKPILKNGTLTLEGLFHEEVVLVKITGFVDSKSSLFIKGLRLFALKKVGV